MSDSAHNRSTQATLGERVIALVRQVLGQPAASRPLPIDARLSDLGMSSLKMINLMLAIELQFDLAIPQADITPDNFASISSVEALILKLTQSPA